MGIKTAIGSFVGVLPYSRQFEFNCGSDFIQGRIPLEQKKGFDYLNPQFLCKYWLNKKVEIAYTIVDGVAELNSIETHLNRIPEPSPAIGLQVLKLRMKMVTLAGYPCCCATAKTLAVVLGTNKRTVFKAAEAMGVRVYTQRRVFNPKLHQPAYEMSSCKPYCFYTKKLCLLLAARLKSNDQAVACIKSCFKTAAEIDAKEWSD